MSEEWDKIFETSAYYDNESTRDGFFWWVDLRHDLDLPKLFEKYLGVDSYSGVPVRVSVKEGSIRIDRMEVEK